MLAHTDPLELLAQDALIPVVFPYGATQLGSILDPSSSKQDLEEGASISIPLWMVKSLRHRGMIEVNWPAVYRERYRRKLNAGAECVSMKNLAPYFYEVGNQLNHVVQDLELSRFLSTTFKTRYHELVSKGLNITTGEEMLKLASKLSVEEQQLFTGGRTSVNCVNSWWTGEALDASKQASQHPIFSNKRAADTAQQADQDGANKQQRT